MYCHGQCQCQSSAQPVFVVSKQRGMAACGLPAPAPAGRCPRASLRSPAARLTLRRPGGRCPTAPLPNRCPTALLAPPQAEVNRSQRMEGSFINKSLLTLGTVIHKLRWGWLALACRLGSVRVYWGNSGGEMRSKLDPGHVTALALRCLLISLPGWLAQHALALGVTRAPCSPLPSPTPARPRPQRGQGGAHPLSRLQAHAAAAGLAHGWVHPLAARPASAAATVRPQA